MGTMGTVTGGNVVSGGNANGAGGTVIGGGTGSSALADVCDATNTMTPTTTRSSHRYLTGPDACVVAGVFRFVP